MGITVLPDRYNMQDMKEALKAALIELDAGSPSDQQYRTEDLIEALLSAKSSSGLRETSDKSYRGALAPFARWYPTLPDSVEEIERFLESKPKDTTREWIWKVLKVLYTFAHERYGLPNTMLKVPKPRVKPREPDSLSRTQAKVILAAMETEKEMGLINLYLGQALRASEGINLDGIDIGDDTLRVHGKERDEKMPLLPEVREILIKLMGDRDPTEPVFVSSRGGGLALIAPSTS